MKSPISEYAPAQPSTHYWIEAERQLRIEEYRGEVMLEDLRSMATAITSDPAWSPYYHALMDFTAANLILGTNEAMRLGLMFRQESYQSTGWLVFAAGNSTNFGNIRMLGRWSKNLDRFRIFDTRRDAESWINRNACTHPFRAPTTPLPGASQRISA